MVKVKERDDTIMHICTAGLTGGFRDNCYHIGKSFNEIGILNLGIDNFRQPQNKAFSLVLSSHNNMSE